LGVCLGHQAIGQATGAEIVRAQRLMHGKVDRIHHDGQGLFAGLPNPLAATRYHSLVIRPGTLGDDFEICAWSDLDGGGREIMAIRHKRWPLFGVQFHPESFLTQAGSEMLKHFLAVGNNKRIDQSPPRQIEHGVHTPHPATGTVLTFAQADKAAED
jgi:para-aminobenzoate synthetase component II